ncbi:MAG: shikimate dehydrogenase [Candidatus Zixiibacteriota bacterium]
MAGSSKYKIYGIVGNNLTHSLSPMIHNYLFRQNRINAIYTTFETNDKLFDGLMKAIRTLNISGLNITYPFKQTALDYLDKIDKSAINCGAVNTINNKSGTLHGHNTDIYGIDKTLKDRIKINLKNKQILLLGAGGAARACLNVFLKYKPSEILVMNRNQHRASQMINSFNSKLTVSKIKFRALDNIAKCDKSYDMIINATSADVRRMNGIICALSKNGYLNNTILFDLNYGKRQMVGIINRNITHYEDGLFMLVSQAIKSFKIWTGIEADADNVYRYVRQKIRGK